MELDDTITFSLTAEETVTNNTIKVTANVAAVATEGGEFVSRDIFLMLEKFIHGASWNFSNTRRRLHESGVEELWMAATTRVSDSEHHGLERRAEAASMSGKGMRIRDVHVDTAPPTVMIKDAQKKLRRAILAEALEQLSDINATLGGGYRLGNVDFADATSAGASNRERYATRAVAATFGESPSEQSEGGLGNTMKLTMRASVQYRRNAPTAD